MSIFLFSPLEQPYGLLSNNAILPIIDGDKKYSSVSDFIYCNVFDGAQVPIASRNPLTTLKQLKRELDEKVYLDAIVHGMKTRLAQNKYMRDILKSLKGPISVNISNPEQSRRLSNLFNSIRIESASAMLHNGKWIPIEKVNSVVTGVINQLMKNSAFQSAPFDELLKKYGSTNNTAIRTDILSEIENLDEIVPVLKIKLRDQIYAEEISRFKDALLDATLNSLLRKSHPTLDPSMYKAAKAQNLQNKDALYISRYKDNLYNTYIRGQLDDNEDIINQIQPFIPTFMTTDDDDDEIAASKDNTLVKSMASLAISNNNNTRQNNGGGNDDDEVENLASAFNLFSLNEETTTTTTMPLGPEFFPSHMKEIIIDGKSYRSVVHYAYARLFETLNLNSIPTTINKYVYSEIFEKVQLKPVDVNVFSNLNELVENYQLVKNKIMVERVIANFERAAHLKFLTYPSLVTLTQTIPRGVVCVWMDLDDDILQKWAGSYIQRICRDDPKLVANAKKYSSQQQDVKDITQDIVFKNWMLYRARDYANTIKMFNKINRADLTTIYNLHPDFTIKLDTLKYEDILHHKGGIARYDQTLVLPFILEEFNRFMVRAPSSSISNIIINIVNSFDTLPPSKRTQENARKNLSLIFDRIKFNLKSSIRRKDFIGIILTGVQDYSTAIEPYYRVNAWANNNLRH